jgi:transcriptional regulator with XRE-family HTH domain
MTTEARRERGRRLAEAREKAELSQAEFASRLNTTQAAVSRWETGDRVPSFETRLLIHGVLGIDPYSIEATEPAA